MRKRNARVLAGVLTAALAANSFGLFSPGAAAVEAASRSAIDTEEFATPGKTYQPGVRWWWSGGAVEKDVYKRQGLPMASLLAGSSLNNPALTGRSTRSIFPGTSTPMSAGLAGKNVSPATPSDMRLAPIFMKTAPTCSRSGPFLDISL